MKLAEFDHVLKGSFEPRRTWTAEVTDAAALRRSSRRRRARGLFAHPLTAKGRSCARWLVAVGIRPAGSARGRLVARAERRCRIDAAGDGPGRAGRRWPATSFRAPAHVRRRARLGRFAGETPCQCGIRIVDLSHAPGRDARRCRVISGEVWVVCSREPTPRGLDPGRVGPTDHTEHVVGIAFRHGRSVRRQPPAPDLTGRP